MQVGDYFVVNIVAGKRQLARCISVGSKEKRQYKAVLDRDAIEGKETPFDFKLSEVVATLGKAPTSGSVYGVSVEPLRERIEHSFWGEIRIFADLDDKQRKTLRINLKNIKERLLKQHLPQLPLITEIRDLKGSNLGYYKYHPKGETDTLCVRVDEVLSEFDYQVGHEYGHGIWFRHMMPKQRMSWVRMYHDALTLKDVTAKDLREILDDIRDNGDLAAYWKECDEDTARILKSVFRHIKQVHYIDRRHFEMAMMLGDDVSVYWPKAVELSEKKTLVTDYATKSPEELFAECFAIRFVGKKLPQKIGDLLDKHLRNLVK